MAKRRNQFYVVVAGRKPGIYRTWDECERQVKGFSGAIFKGFVYKDQAEAYFKQNKKKENKKQEYQQPEKNKVTKTVNTGRRWWLEPGYDRRLENGNWNPKYS